MEVANPIYDVVFHPLVAGIHHRSHIIRIPRLASRRREELERQQAETRVAEMEALLRERGASNS